MALNEQMQQMVQQDIKDAETRPKEEILQEQMEGLKTVGRTARDIAVESIPGVSEALAEKRVDEALQRGDTTGAIIEGAAGLMGAVPMVGDILSRPIRAAAKKLRKQDSDAATKMLNDVESIETWKKQNPNPKPQKQNPSIEKAANDLLEGKITGKQYRSVVKENMPIQKIEEVPEVPSFTEIVGALDKDKSAKGIIGLNKKIKDGTRVSSRLDIPAYERFDKWVVSVHDAFDKKGRESLSGDIMGYGKTAVLKNVEFKGSPTGAASISARKTDKGTIARIFGDYYNAEPENVEEYARQVIKDKDWTQVGYNPFRHGFFYDKDTGMPVKSAEEVIQVGPLVLAKNAQKIKISEAKQVGPKGGLKIRTGKPIEGLQNLKETKTVFNEGGVVPMKRMTEQMELFEPVERGFEDGGLMDEGGMIDEQSGNEVPPGSLREEVRDDIPAQLSEGEFVMPADVVRYHGLDKMMALRDEAKAGLQRMEAMGQMGNADEATIPDGVPFNMDDLEIEDEQEELNFQVGGVVTAPGTGIAGSTAAAPSTTGFTPLPPAPTVQTPITAASATASPTGTYQPELAGTKFTPTTIAPLTPTFQQTVGAGVPGVDFEYVTYVNEAGQTIRLRKSKSTGELIDPIPEGYSLQTEETQTTQTAPTTVATTRTTQDRDDSGRDEGGPATGASIALGGTPFGPSVGGGIPGTRYAGPSRAVKGATTFDVSFDVPGTLPGALGAASLVPSLLSKTGGLPKDATATLTSRGTSRASVKLSADVYNKVRNDPRGKLAKDITEVMNKVDSFADQGATNKDLNNAYAQNSVDRATRAEDVRQASQLEGAARDRAFDDIIDREVKAAEASESYAEQQGAVTSATTSTPQGTVTGMIDEYDEPAPSDNDKGGKIVCTAMNNAYGFGSFRQTVWLQHSKNMDPAYQKGYHRIFRPLIKFAYKDQKWYNMAVRNTLEGIARRRTADIWMQKHNKRHLRGAIERAILEPLCYIVGKIK